jgi:hypothetical protein
MSLEVTNEQEFGCFGYMLRAKVDSSISESCQVVTALV